MLNRLVCWAIRRKLKLKLFEEFQFENQVSNKHYYYFNKDRLMKVHWTGGTYLPPRKSNVSLNFLLSEEVEVKRKKQWDNWGS